LVPGVRKFTTTKKDPSSENTFSSTVDAAQKIAKDANVKEEQNSARSASSTDPSIDTGNLKPQNLPSSPPLSSTIQSTQSSSLTAPPPLTSASVATPSLAESSAPLVPPEKSDAIDDGVIVAYYDRFFRLWSERSGTTEILALKESVNEAGAAFDTASAAVTTNRRNLDDALRKWERASGQHLQLLQRRESWTPEDAQRFADFVSLEITSRAELEQSRHDLGRSEELLTKSQLDYINKMRRRYHEEQIWQDQWRVLGTYGTWTLIVLNSCVFLGSQFFQRRRERDRTETIERLIRESKSDEGQNAQVDKEMKEMITSAKATDLNVEEKNAMVSDTKEEKVVKSEEEPASFHTSDVEQNDTMKPKVHKLKKNLHPTVERVGRVAASISPFVKRWEHRVRSNVKDFAGSVNQKLLHALPANIADEMPKSLSEIHLPSAVIGASVGGIAALTISMIFSSFSNRRY
jgi:hypothetical protein